MVRDAVMGIKLVNLDHVRFHEKHGIDLLKACDSELSELEAEGFVTLDSRNISLTDHGVLFGDYVGRVLEGGLKKLSGESTKSRTRVLF